MLPEDTVPEGWKTENDDKGEIFINLHSEEKVYTH